MALTDNLISYYKLESNSNDSVGTLNGTDTSITYGGGKIGNGAIGNGTSSKITTASTTLFTGNDISISFWIKPGASQSEVIETILDYNHGISQGWVIQSENATSTGRYYFTWHNGTGFQGAGTSNGVILTPNVWQHICFTKSGTTTKGYVNGVESWSFTGTGTLVAGNYPLTILAWQGTGRNFNGTIDELGIWSRALTSGEITSLYNSGAGLQYPFTSTNSSAFLFFLK